MSRSYFAAIPLFLILAALQATILSRLTVLGHNPQIVVLAAIAWATIRGVEEGIVWAFIAGIALDFYSIGPTGGSALAIMAAVGVVFLLQLGLPPNRFLLPPLFGGLGTSVVVLVYGGLIWVSGYTADWSIFNNIVLFAIAQTAVMIPVYWALYAFGRILYPPSVESSI